MINILSDAGSLFLLWLFVLAGAHKLQPANTQYYKQVIGTYGFERLADTRGFLFALGFSELAAGIAIALPSSRMLGAAMICIFLTGYLALIAAQLLQGRKDLDCGCAGPLGGTKVGKELLVRNALLLGMAMFCLFNSSSAFANTEAWSLIIPLSLLTVICYLCSEQLIANAQNLKKLPGRS
ncbi:MAG: MauE/DoxX family redox-associated membrane protein [Pseudomonadales bacterium]